MLKSGILDKISKLIVSYNSFIHKINDEFMKQKFHEFNIGFRNFRFA